MKIGINKISFYAPKYYLDLKTLAYARNVEPEKYTKGLLTNKMSVVPMNQDIVSMAANATLNYLTKEDIKDIDLILFTTETGQDYSKSAATHLISILGLRNDVRAVELKQACYATTAALYFAKGHILQNPNSKVLVLASDIARYGLESPGEPTQGAGAVSILVSKDPNIMVLENEYGIYSEDIYDFWRPDGSDYAMVDGQYSNEQYKKFFLKTYNDYLTKTQSSISDFSALTFHIPYSKIGLRSLELVAEKSTYPQLFNNFDKAIIYNKEIGNIYTGSLFLSLIALFEFGNLKASDKVGMFGYGSGAVAEFFVGTMVSDYKAHLLPMLHKKILDSRTELKINEYEYLITNKTPKEVILDKDTHGRVQLESILNFQRKYKINI
ncbi:hydroxymethylglutaryl-CoA synthase [Acholeplasma granularum]|uniref:hydroxymethylglutaryl-CoA synthase n=1 Tax=Acholeplasma granularum TaxID=264635 RepID=UPI000472B2BC|nr:hydroxymethylglutaryl-CoA synthase [Acholeplasma granularum]